MNMRNIERNPATYAALISFFETYLATLGEPVVRLSNQVREGDQIDKADLAYKLITIADESFTMLKKLESLRGEHSKADRVTVSLSS